MKEFRGYGLGFRVQVLCVFSLLEKAATWCRCYSKHHSHSNTSGHHSNTSGHHSNTSGVAVTAKHHSHSNTSGVAISEFLDGAWG